MSGLGSTFGKIYGSTNPPTDFNPLSMAEGFTDQMGGGQQLSEMARAVLTGALQQTGMTATTQGGGPYGGYGRPVTGGF
jgi:hypothetical protein